MGKHIVFAVPPGHGHVNPTLPLVEELVARGHRITYLTGADLLPKVAAIGATPIETPWAMPERPPGPFKFSVEMFAGMQAMMRQLAEQALPGLLEHFQQDRPDVICFDGFSPIGVMLAAKLDVPMVGLMPSMAFNEHHTLRDMIVRGGMAADEQLDKAMAAMAEGQAAFRASLGLAEPATGVLSLGPSAPLNLVFVPREFQIAGDSFDNRYRFLGPAVGSRADDESWQPPADGSPVLFISLGTAFNDRSDFYDMCVEAFGNSRWHVVMAVGSRVELPEAPANFEIAAHVPQPAVLAATTVFLSHTGMNSTLESLYYGVPLVSVPQMPEQTVNGGRVVELGMGRQLDPEAITAQLLRDTVEEVATDPVIRANVTKFGEQLRTVDGPALGADALEELLGS
ncbi:macrolide family glycosyltransferase [Kutzneria sp. CA-103260]|uniref:macrolide family glycosyltransferase n=1 Tax=Kutzneria sp. CA-103260 TaxID=2802641 RepID=UPI001BAD01F7|nr:macrolide family glycosyltransferase [Kutzneria sp. CA-103260]QUQ67529.1 UDP glycosyl transferase [Kutzneria sp. CA-103260]